MKFNAAKMAKNIGLGTAAFALLLLLRTTALKLIWVWFIVPGFNVAPISNALALGIICAAAVIQNSTYDGREKTENENLRVGLALYLNPILVLAIAWFVKTFAI